MDTIKKILEILDYESADELELGSHISLERGGVMDLTIEKVMDDRLSVAHYYTQRGDMMRDPEIVFDTSGDEWVPIEYRQDPMMHQHDKAGVDLGGFDKQWSENLKNQGFIEAAKERAAVDE